MSDCLIILISMIVSAATSVLITYFYHFTSFGDWSDNVFDSICERIKKAKYIIWKIK